MSKEINHNRRRFLGAVAMTTAAARLGLIGSADAQSNKTNPAKAHPIKPGTNMSFGSLKQIDAGLLNVGYTEAGPANGPAVILLHGWPYDIHSYVDVAPLLASAGYRVLVPYLRGYGATRFLSKETFRNGQQSAIAVDIIALMDALKIGKAIIGGFDWGARKAQSSQRPPSPLKATPMARHTWTPVPTPKNSRANTLIGSSRVASGTTRLKKRRRRLSKLSSMSTAFNRG